MNNKKISVISGGFDPLHSGHISYLKDSREAGDFLIVLLNSDEWLKKKKGKYFLTFKERKIILENIKFVDLVLAFEDDDIGSCINGLKKVLKKYPKNEIIFCNGGDRTKTNIPEMTLKEITFKFGIGGKNKQNSSSLILKNFLYKKEKRIWGEFSNLFSEKNTKVKELVIKPKQGMSFQRHFHRNEIWFVSQGSCLVYFSKTTEKEKKEFILKKGDTFFVKKK